MQTGVRVLNPAEAALLRVVIGSMCEERRAEERRDDQWSYGAAVFDNMSLAQRMLSLFDVCNALLDPTSGANGRE